ncbi:hypothetical protein RvY_03717-2 [Ramazzottius varieornatus]|nr:hypothetical protein RvY_03717-2 [Ramazzottius varieornatus]
MAILEPCLPIWLLETMQAEQWQLGTAFIPDSVGYFLGSSFFGVLALRVGRWKCSMAAMLVVGMSCICIPFATAIWHLIIPHFGLGLGIGIVDASFMPLLALLVDLRHEAVYGSVFAVAQLAVCLAYSAGKYKDITTLIYLEADHRGTVKAFSKNSVPKKLSRTTSFSSK